MRGTTPNPRQFHGSVVQELVRIAPNEILTLSDFSSGKWRGPAHHGSLVPLDDRWIVELIRPSAFHWVVDDTYRQISL